MTTRHQITLDLTDSMHEYSFHVDKEFDRMTVSICVTERGWYSVFIWDPQQVLRAQVLCRSERKEVTISSNKHETSYSTIPGKIGKGKWKIVVESSTIQKMPIIDFSIELGNQMMKEFPDKQENWCSSQNKGLVLNQYDKERVYNRQKRWYKGDFHTHTNLSDGKLTPKQGMEQAKKMNLDFFVPTDHNIVPTKWVKDELLVIPGIEITSSKGHFNALGLLKWVDWRPSCPDGGMESEEGMNRIIREVHEAGGIVSINHPMLKPWEWQFQDTELESIDTIEIWNDPTYQDNPKATEEALQLWDALLNDGYRIYGIGGSDSHLLPTESYEEGGPPSVIGDPATYVLADQLSYSHILTAVRKGNVYVSRGPVLEFTIEVNGEQIELGNEIISKQGEDVNISYTLTYDHTEEGSYVRWIQDGKEVQKDDLHLKGSNHREFIFPKDVVTWVRVEVRSKDGKLLAFGNPIFRGRKKPLMKRRKDLMDNVQCK